MISIEKSSKPLTGSIFVPGDKSISHRSIMFGAISEGTTEITGFLGQTQMQYLDDNIKKRLANHAHFDAAIAAVAHKKFDGIDVPALLKEKHVIFDVKCKLDRSIVDGRL